MLGEDSIRKAELVDKSNKVVYAFKSHNAEDEQSVRILQEGVVDGVVTGIRGADDTMHLYVRDHQDRDLTIVVKDEELARGLLSQFRTGMVRLYLHGMWERSANGWTPIANKCVLDGYEVLDDMPLSAAFAAMRKVDGNRWMKESDPLETLRRFREGD